MNKDTKPTTRIRSIGSTMRRAWDDQVTAHRALLRLTPYFDAHRDDGR